MLTQHKRNRRQKTAQVKMNILPDENIILFDMRSQSTTKLKVYYRSGGLVIAFKVPSNVRVCRDGL